MNWSTHTHNNRNTAAVDLLPQAVGLTCLETSAESYETTLRNIPEVSDTTTPIRTFCNFSYQTGRNRLGSAKRRKVAINKNSQRVDVTSGENCVMLAAEIKAIKPKRQLNHRGAHKTSPLNHSSGLWRAIRNTLSCPIKMKWLVYRPPHVLPPSDGATTTFLIPELKITFISEQLCPWGRKR